MKTGDSLEREIPEMNDCTSDRYLNSPAIQTYITAQAVASDQACAVIASDLEQQRRKVEEEVDLLTAETLSSFRRSRYAAVTIPSSVKYKVNAGQFGSMARPRSPQKKNDVDHEQLQFLLDQQLSVIRQQLNSLSSERSKMEQKMEDLANGIKEVRVQCGRMPFTSQPGFIRRVRSVEHRGPYMIKPHHRRQASKNETYSPTLEEVEGEEDAVDGQYSSVLSLSSSVEHRESDVTSLSDSMGSSLFSSVSSLPVSGTFRKDSNQNMRVPSIRTQRPSSVSELLERNFSPTPIPELPESPSSSRPNTPMFFATYSPRLRPRCNSSFSSFGSVYHRSPKLHSAPSLAISEQSLLRPGSRGSPRSPSLRKAVKSAIDMRNGSSTSSLSHKKRNPEIQQSPKDKQLSYFRRNSLTDNSFKESTLSVTDDECELKGSADTLSQGSSPTDNDAPTKGNGKSLILRRSSLTGQIEHVTNLRAQVRRNSSFNAPVETVNVPFHGRWSMSCSQGSIKGVGKTVVSRQSSSTSNAATSFRKSRVILLESRETTV